MINSWIKFKTVFSLLRDDPIYLNDIPWGFRTITRLINALFYIALTNLVIQLNEERKERINEIDNEIEKYLQDKEIARK